jgi:hypothetical protein
VSNRTLGKTVLFSVGAFIYGAVLAFCAILSTAGGDASYVLFGLFTSPLGFFGVPAAAFGTPFLWASIGLLLSTAASRVSRWSLILTMTTHYAMTIPLLTITELADWDRLWRYCQYEPGWLSIYLAWYLSGQIGIWLLLARALVSQKRRWRSLSSA